MAFVGIDLGTTTSEVAVFEKEAPRILRDVRGNEIVDSYFGFDKKTKNPVVGSLVKSVFQSDPGFGVEQVKRRMGEEIKIPVGDQEFTPEEVSAHILKHLKESAEEQLDEEVDRCVITVPANFTDRQRRATRQAGAIAGIKVERIINEPTAAALAYGFVETIEDEHLMVYDLGGGTFDVSIVDYMGDIVEVKASAGDTLLGGKDFDEALLKHVAAQFEQETGIRVEPKSGNYYRLLFACEDAKKELSFNQQTSINIPFFDVKDGAPVNLDITVRRSTFEGLISEKVERTEQAIEKALKDAGLSKTEVAHVLLVGGSTRIPMVQKFVERVMGQRPSKALDPDKAVALGAAAQAAIVDGLSNQIIMDVCPLSLGTAAMEMSQAGVRPGRYTEIIPTNGKLLKEYTESFRTLYDGQEIVNFRVYQRKVESSALQAEIEGKANEAEGFTLLTSEQIRVPSGPAGQVLEVKYMVTANGTIDVSVHFPSTGETVELQAAAELDDQEVEASRQRLEAAWQQSEFLEEVEALLAAADRELEGGSVPPEREDELRELLDQMKQALAANNEEGIRSLEEEITDLLFEID